MASIFHGNLSTFHCIRWIKWTYQKMSLFIVFVLILNFIHRNQMFRHFLQLDTSKQPLVLLICNIWQQHLLVTWRHINHTWCSTTMLCRNLKLCLVVTVIYLVLSCMSTKSCHKISQKWIGHNIETMMDCGTKQKQRKRQISVEI